jgi:hypothetical protein
MKKLPIYKAIESHKAYENEIARHIEAINQACEARGWEHIAVSSLGMCETGVSYRSSKDSLMAPSTLSNMLSGLQTLQLGHAGLCNIGQCSDSVVEVLADSHACAVRAPFGQ